MIDVVKTITIDETTLKALQDFKKFFDELDEIYNNDYNIYEVLECLCEREPIYGYDLIITESIK